MPLRSVEFKKQLRMWFTPEQDAWLTAEVKRRVDIKKSFGKIGNRPHPLGVSASLEGLHPAAVGKNGNVNKAMLLRDALERQHHITSKQEARDDVAVGGTDR
jgi:hypothetical protein